MSSDLPVGHGAFAGAPRRQQVVELRAAGERERAEARAAAERAKARPLAIAGRRPGLERPGEHQLQHAGGAFRRALLSLPQDPESAKALVEALREADRG